MDIVLSCIHVGICWGNLALVWNGLIVFELCQISLGCAAVPKSKHKPHQWSQFKRCCSSGSGFGKVGLFKEWAPIGRDSTWIQIISNHWRMDTQGLVYCRWATSETLKNGSRKIFKVDQDIEKNSKEWRAWNPKNMLKTTWIYNISVHHFLERI